MKSSGNHLYKLLLLILLLPLVSCDTVDDDGPDYICNIPCLVGVPVVSTNSVSSATGGTIEVTLELTGDVDFTGVGLSQFQFDCESAPFLPGDGIYNAVGGVQYVFTIIVPAGQEVCGYYPNVYIEPNSSEPYYGYYWRHTSQNNKYYYKEDYSDGVTHSGYGPAQTPYNVPVINITP